MLGLILCFFLGILVLDVAMNLQFVSENLVWFVNCQEMGIGYALPFLFFAYLFVGGRDGSLTYVEESLQWDLILYNK